MALTTRVLLIFAVLCWGAGAHAATYWVSPQGSDSNGCTNSVTPLTTGAKRTINNALNCLDPGDTLYIRAGTYAEQVGINTQERAGTASQKITIAGYPGDAKPILRAPATGEGAKGFSISWSTSPEPGHFILRDFELDGINQLNNSTCLQLESPEILVDNLTIRHCARDGIQAFGANLTLRNLQIYNCGRIQPPQDSDTKGLSVYFGQSEGASGPVTGGNSVLENSLIDGCRAGGIVSHYGLAQNNIFRNNIIRNYGLSSPHQPPPGFTQYGTGITIGSGSGNAQVYNNVIYNGRGNGSQAFVFWGTDANLIAHNTVYNVDTVYWTLCSAGATETTRRNNLYASINGAIETLCAPITGLNSHNFTGNPGFVNAGAGDFHLTAGSAAIGYGESLSAVPTDKDGLTRPNPPSAGAYEFTTATPNSYSVTRNLDTVVAGGNITASWATTPGPAQPCNWICLTTEGQTCQNFIPTDGAGNPAWVYIGGSVPTCTTAPLTGNFTLAAPLQAGNYRFWYCVNNSLTNCPAQSPPFTVSTPPVATGLVVRAAAWHRADVPLSSLFIEGPGGSPQIRPGGKLRYVAAISWDSATGAAAPADFYPLECKVGGGGAFTRLTESCDSFGLCLDADTAVSMGQATTPRLPLLAGYTGMAGVVVAKPINPSVTVAPAHQRQFEMEYVVKLDRSLPLSTVQCRPIRHNNSQLDAVLASPPAKLFLGQATLRGRITGGTFR